VVDDIKHYLPLLKQSDAVLLVKRVEARIEQIVEMEQ